MTRSQRLQIEQSEKREKVNALLDKGDALTDAERSELSALTGRLQELEPELRAALTVEAAEAEQRDRELGRVPDAEHRERLDLRVRARLTNYLTARAQGLLPSGPEAELCAAAGVQGIPLELFEPDPRERRAAGDGEHRATAAVPGTVGINLDPIRPAVFSTSIASRLGIDMPRVASGTYATATISTSQSAAALAKSGAAAGVAGAMTTQTTGPKRVSARLELTLEDIAAVGAENFESALRQNLAFALSAELDDQAINGDGNAPNLNGLLNRLTNPSAPAANVETFDRLIAIFAGGVDGLWATMADQVAIVCNPETYRLSLQTFRDAAGQDLGDMSFADYARKHFGGWWTNARMPDKTNHVAPGILYRMGRSAMGASMGMRTAVCPHYGEVAIDDIYSGSAKAERYFTMHVLLGDVIIVQPDAYAEVAFRVSS